MNLLTVFILALCCSYLLRRLARARQRQREADRRAEYAEARAEKLEQMMDYLLSPRTTPPPHQFGDVVEALDNERA